jgi:hypothetical protein
MRKQKNQNQAFGEEGSKFPEAVMASLGESSFTVKASSEDSCSRESSTSYRRNASANITKTDRYSNIEKGIVPFVYGTGHGNYDSNISAKDAILLCQKAYWNVPIFRNTIDLMTEFSLSDIYLTGGNEQSRKFFELWLSKIKSWELQDQFYREFYRSGNIFLYKFRADFGRLNMMKVQTAFAESEKELSSDSIPVKYIILNPADINIISSSAFLNNIYVKVLNDYELGVLLNPKTDYDKKIANNIPEIKNLLDKNNKSKNKSNFMNPMGLNNVSLELDGERLISIFYKKQNYEPLSVPMGFAVLEDINSKLELKKIDQAIARSVQQAVLLITMGDEKIGLPSSQNLSAMRKLFENQSVGKVLVADYTTNAKFVIPDIGSLLDPKKYEILDTDIRMGLNSILFGEEKFSSASIKVKVFFARLKYGREKFLREFLIPEMQEIGKKLGFKSIPIPKFEDVDFEDNVLMSRVYSRLIELGVLTPEEGIRVFETGRMPNRDESIESQKKFKEFRDAGYYQPLVGGGAPKELDKSQTTSSSVGRPSGSSGLKQSVKREASANVEKKLFFSCDKMKNVLSEITFVEKEIEQKLKKNFSLKRLNVEQKSVASEVGFQIFLHEKISDWRSKIDDYIKDPGANINKNSEQLEEIDSLAARYTLESRSACILYHSA